MAHPSPTRPIAKVGLLLLEWGPVWKWLGSWLWPDAGGAGFLIAVIRDALVCLEKHWDPIPAVDWRWRRGRGGTNVQWKRGWEMSSSSQWPLKSPPNLFHEALPCALVSNALHRAKPGPGGHINTIPSSTQAVGSLCTSSIHQEKTKRDSQNIASAWPQPCLSWPRSGKYTVEWPIF